jgi:tight adherence protein B
MILAMLLVALAMLLISGAMVAAPVISHNSGRNRLRRRLDRVSGKGAIPMQGAVPVTVRREVADSSIQTLDRLIKRLLPRPAKLRERLAATGRRISLGEYVLASLLIAGVSYIGAHGFGLSTPVALMFAFGDGLYWPHWTINRMKARRQRAFLSLFPEAIELMVRGLKSGVPVGESLKVVGQEMVDPVGVEFRSITDALVLGQTFDDALAAASRRLDLPEFRFFVVSLNIQQETGGNLGETLENLAVILRKRKQMKLKVKALSSEARASAYIVGSLPFLMFAGLTVMNPDYMTILFTDPRGNVVLGAAVGTLALGVGIMIRMGKLEI